MGVSSTANTALRRVILAAADTPSIRRFVGQHGLRLGAARFVAGETLDEAVPVLRRLNEQGLSTNTTILGEHVSSVEASARAVAAYEGVIERIAAERLRTNVALKLTHLGLDLDEDLALENVARLALAAARRANFVRIDMEESRWVDATLRIYRQLRARGHDNVGTVLQAYLYRSEQDLRSLLELEPNLRIVKGAYLEPRDVAYPGKSDVDSAYARLVESSLRHGRFTAVATHDERLIEHALGFAEREGIPRDRYQLQMLYGVRSQLQRELASRGYSVLVATPHGPDWYPYLMRRLAERPANTLFFIRALARR